MGGTNAGKLNRGISVCDTVEILKGAPLTEDEYRRAAILGWCIELVSRACAGGRAGADGGVDAAASVLPCCGRHDGPVYHPPWAALLVPCRELRCCDVEELGADRVWLVSQEGVGNIAINDSFMLEAAIYYLLKKHFRQESYYVDLLELFHEVRRVNEACGGWS